MGCIRLLYRRKHILFLLLCATTVWLIYHIFSFTSEQVVHATDLSRKEVALEHTGRDAQETLRKATDAVHNPKDSGVLQLPPRKEDIQFQEGKEGVLPPSQKGEKTKAPSTPSPAPVVKENLKGDGKKESVTPSTGASKKDKSNVTQKAKPKEEGHLDRVLKIGEKMKNKTMEKLSQLGVIKSSNPLKYIFVPDVWKLQLTLDDLSQVMKDTNHLSKQEKIDVNYPKLLPVKSNVTEGNLTVALRKVVMENRVGFCDCRDYECMCCSRVTHKRIQVNMTGCANITFMSKSQELDFKFSMDKNMVYKKQIAVEPAPKICLGSHSKVADICVNFLNMTSKVTVLEDHKFLVVGCLEFSISLFNKTVSAFPVDCFQMPSHQHHQKEESEKKIAQDLGNWMP